MATVYEHGVDDWCFGVVPPTHRAAIDVGEAADDGAADPVLPAIATHADLDTFLLDYFGIVLPNVQVCAHHSTPWRAFHEAYFGVTCDSLGTDAPVEVPVSVWKASRGFGGKTFTLGLLTMVEGLTLRADVNVLGGSGVQSKRVLEHISSLWEKPTAPRWCLAGSSTNSQIQKLKWGNRIQALMASSKSVRGPHPQRLRIDEADETKVGLISDALGQPMSKGWVKAQVVLSSTHQYPNGPMTWVLQEAASKGWSVHEWCLHETKEPHGWLPLDEMARKRKIMTTVAWNTEVELQEPSGEGRAIVPECVKAAFVEDLKLEDPVAGAEYGTGADWAKKVNHTVVPTIRKDVKPARIVAIERTQRKPYPVMAKILNDRIAFYGGAAAHDNSGLGSVVQDLLEVPQGRIEHFEFAGRERNEMLSEYIADLEQGLILWPFDPTHPALDAAFKEHLYATVGDVYGRKDEGHLPDTISAAALAWRACKAIIAASAVADPDPADTPVLGAGIQRGRLMGGRPGMMRRSPGDPLPTVPKPAEPDVPDTPKGRRSIHKPKPTES